MRKLSHLAIAFALTMVASAQSQSASSTPQTARQALLEMLFSKTPGAFAKHLPVATLTTLQKSGAFTTLQQYSLLAGQLETTGNRIETFETGYILVSVDDPKGKKFEMTVENDSLRGDEDDIELSFETYKDREPQRTPFLPRMTLVMKSETGVWKLNEIQITVRLPLADPDFLKSIADGLKARAATTTGIQPKIQVSSNNFAGATPVVSAMRTILAAENTYSGRYPATGYTCTLSDLDGFGGGEPNEHQAMLISSGLASGRKFGYTFTLSGCGGSPATSFHLGAAPAGTSNFGQRAYCADQSAAVRYSTDGNLATCFASGLPMP